MSETTTQGDTAATKITPEAQALQDGRVGLALQDHLRGWLAHRLAARAARDITMTSFHHLKSPGLVWAGVGCVAREPGQHANDSTYVFATCDDTALARQHGGRGRFLIAELEQHEDSIRCAINEKRERLDAIVEAGSYVSWGMLKHGIVDSSKVSLSIMPEGDPLLTLMRWLCK